MNSIGALRALRAALDGLGFLADVADQRGEAAAQSRSPVLGHGSVS